MTAEFFNNCSICGEQTEISKADFERGTYICQSCLKINKIDTNNVQLKSVVKKPKRKAVPLLKPVRFFISLLQIAIVGLSFYGLFELMPSGIAYSLLFLGSVFAFWLQKIKMGYNPFISEKEYEINPKDALRQDGYNYDPFISNIELYKRHKAEKEAGRKFTQKEWDEYYEKYQKEHPPKELFDFFKKDYGKK